MRRTIALKGVGECKVPGLGCGLHAAPGSERRPAGCGVLVNSPLEKVKDGPATGGTCGDVTVGEDFWVNQPAGSVRPSLGMKLFFPWP